MSNTMQLMLIRLVVAAAGLTASPLLAQEDTLRINDPGIEPFGGMVQQVIERRRAYVFAYRSISTGFIIGPRLVLTNAHNMHSPLGSKVIGYRGYIGRTGDQYLSETTIKGRKAIKSSCWIPPAYHWWDFPNDYAIVRLGDDQPALTTKFELALADTVLQIGDTVFVSGYPFDRAKLDGEKLILSKGVIMKNQNKDKMVIRYTNWTLGGNSGSPVWVERNGRFLVVGVHAGGQGDTAVAKKVDQAFMDAVAKWTHGETPEN